MKLPRSRPWVLALCGVVLMLLAIGLTWRVWYEWYLLHALHAAIQGRPGQSWSWSLYELDEVTDQIKEAGLKERSIKVVVPFVRSHEDHARSRALLYIMGEFEHPPEVVAQALLEAANDPSFDAISRGEAADVLLLLKPDEPTRQRAQTRNQASKNNLRMLGLAMDNYADRETTLPPGTLVDEQGTTLHGWEAVILSFVDQAPLHKQIDFTKAWDSPENLELFRTPLPIFQDPRYAELKDADGLPVSHYAANELVLKPGRGMRFDEITDGLSNTLLAGTIAGDPRGWGTPFNLRDPSEGLNAGPKSFGSPEGKSAILLFADGSARVVKEKVSPEVLKALGTPAGGEKVSLP